MTKRKTNTNLTGSSSKVHRRGTFDLDATIALSMTDLYSDIEDEFQFQNLDQERSDQEDLDDTEEYDDTEEGLGWKGFDDEEESEDEEESDDEEENNDEKERATHSQYYQADTTINDMPLTIYDNILENPIAQCFIGFFAADGISLNDRHFTGINLRSTDFPFLYNLLKACGVKKPKLTYTFSDRENVVYQAARHSLVRWQFVNKKFVELRRELGLPSSNIHNTNVGKARKFLSSLDKPSLLRVFLFWVAGDGTIAYNRIANNILSYTNTRLYSRDEKILPIFKELLESHGFKDCITVATDKTKDNFYMLRIGNTGFANEALLEALNSVPGSILHPKLRLLKLTLESSGRRIAVDKKSSRLPFYDFLQHNLLDKELGVLGQDFHPLPLQSVNAILDFAGFEQLEKINDFDLVKFRKQAEELLKSKGAKNERQKLFLRYYQFCKKRTLQDYKPVNYKPKSYDPLFKCTIPGCNWSFVREDHLLRHVRTSHASDATNRLACTHPGCNKTFARKDGLKRHMDIHNPDRERYPCTFAGCGKTFSRKDNLKAHMRSHEPDREMFPCPFPGCTKLYKNKSSISKHMRTKHQKK